MKPKKPLHMVRNLQSMGDKLKHMMSTPATKESLAGFAKAQAKARALNQAKAK